MKLSDSQTVLLKAASIHPKRLLTDFPPKLKGGALIIISLHIAITCRGE